jgi:hypothetical protein
VKLQAFRFNLVLKIVEVVWGVNRNRRERLCKGVDGCGKKGVEKDNRARFGKRTLYQKIKGATAG